MLLARGDPQPVAGDLSAGGSQAISLRARLRDGAQIELEASPPGSARTHGGPVPVLFMPARLRSGGLLAHASAHGPAASLAQQYFPTPAGASSASTAAGMLAALERFCEAREAGLVLLIEEPELFLRPQAQRYLYRLLRAFADNGNQVLYSTHEPAFLNVGRLG